MGKDIIPQDKPSKLRKQAEKNLEIRLKPTEYTDKDMKLLELIAAHIAPILDSRLKKTSHF